MIPTIAIKNNDFLRTHVMKAINVNLTKACPKGEADPKALNLRKALNLLYKGCDL
jgi:hypothetical protein